MQFDWTVSLGTVLSALVIVSGTWAAASRLYSLVDKRLAMFQERLGAHSSTLEVHAEKMEKQDDMLLKISQDLHRLIGRMEILSDLKRQRENS